MNFIKDNGGVLAVGAVVLVIAGLLADWRIDTKIETAMKEKGLVSTTDVTAIEDKMASVKGEVEKLEETHDKDTEEWKRRVEKIVDILLAE